MLKLIAKHLPPDLDPKKVKNRYFAIFEMLQKHCVDDVFLKNSETTQILPVNILKSTDLTAFGHRNEVFLDISEKFVAILDTNLGVVRSDAVGKIFCRTNLASPAEIRVPIVHDPSVEFLSNNRWSYDGHVRTFQVMGHGSFVVATYVKMDADPPVFVQKTRKGYEITMKRAMDWVKTTVPLQQSAYNVQVFAEKGTANYHEKRSAVEWEITDPSTRKAELSLKASFLDKEDNPRVIQVEFSGPGNVCPVSAKSVKSKTKVDSYVKYKVQSRFYEIRDSPK